MYSDTTRAKRFAESGNDFRSVAPVRCGCGEYEIRRCIYGSAKECSWGTVTTGFLGNVRVGHKVHRKSTFCSTSNSDKHDPESEVPPASKYCTLLLSRIPYWAMHCIDSRHIFSIPGCPWMKEQLEFLRANTLVSFRRNDRVYQLLSSHVEPFSLLSRSPSYLSGSDNPPLLKV